MKGPRKAAGNGAPELREEGFLDRWRRRKREAGESAEPSSSPSPSTDADSSVLDSAEPQSAAPVLTDDDMPDLGTLNEDSEYAGFLSPGVSEELRRLALRKLFHSATFNVCDGLDDYDEDFTTFQKLGEIVTADMRHGRHEKPREPAARKDSDGDEPTNVDTGAADSGTTPSDVPADAAGDRQAGQDEVNIAAGARKEPRDYREAVAEDEKTDDLSDVQPVKPESEDPRETKRAGRRRT